MKKIIAGFLLGFGCVIAGVSLGWADDLSDGIAEVTDDPISSYDSLGGKDTNISFIVTDAIAKSKMVQKNGKNEDGKDKINFNDGETENNENSVVVEPGSQVDKVYNIVIEK